MSLFRKPTQALPGFLFISLFLTTSISPVFAQPTAGTVYAINASGGSPPLRSDHLKLGGSNRAGETVAVNNVFVSLNGQPIIPITGEFHYSRYPRAYWEESIRKMKAGGINMVATYVFWNMHEEREGKFTWTDDRDLRHFIELCAKNKIKAIVRIGPFGHGEIRNGALPDWLLGKALSIRSNDPAYLRYVERLYNEIGQQLKGLLFADGGPVIAIQLENEYQHAAAPWGLTYPGQPMDFTSDERDRAVTQEGVGVTTNKNPYAELGNDHLRVLKTLATKAGLIAPIYTVTGWGNAAVIASETLPVMAGYPYPTWTPKKDISPFYLFTDLRKKPDYAPVRYKSDDYPYFCAELGGGIMTTYSRRPVVPAPSLDALINRCLGSGANGIGYYMFHGGSTPKGQDFFFNDEAYAYPKISYDFQAPISEYGQLRPSFHRLKVLHYFMNSFSPELAPMVTRLPTNAPSLQPTNVTDLRYAVRTNGKSGFLFLNNFQDDTLMTEKRNLQFAITTDQGLLRIPETSTLTLKSDENAIFPFNLPMAGVTLQYATAQLLTRFTNGRDAYYLFFAPNGIAPELSIIKQKGLSVTAGQPVSLSQNASRYLVRFPENGLNEVLIRKPDGSLLHLLLMDKATALTAWVSTINEKSHVVFSEAVMLTDTNQLSILSYGKNKVQVSIYPKIITPPVLSRGNVTALSSRPFLSTYQLEWPSIELSIQATSVNERKWTVNLPGSLPESANDIILNVDYTGDTGMAFQDGQLVADDFYKGTSWQIGLRQFIAKPTKDRSLLFYFRPIVKDAPFLVDIPPEIVKMFPALKMNSVTALPEYRTELTF